MQLLVHASINLFNVSEINPCSVQLTYNIKQFNMIFNIINNRHPIPYLHRQAVDIIVGCHMSQGQSCKVFRFSLLLVSTGYWTVMLPGPCITNVIAICCKNFSQWERSFLWKLRCHWLKFLRRVAKTLVIQGPGHHDASNEAKFPSHLHQYGKSISEIKGHQSTHRFSINV